MDINIEELFKKDSKYTELSKSDIRHLEIDDYVIVRKKNRKNIVNGVITHKTFFYYILKVGHCFRTIKLNEYNFLKLNNTETFMNYLLESIENETIINI